MYNQYYQNPLTYGRQDYMQQAQQQVPASYGLKGRPVSSFEEARAAQIDFDGSLFVFPDIANNRIYTKQIGFNGAAAINVYELVKEPQDPTPQYITRDEFNAFVASLKKEEPQPQIVKKEEPQQNKAISMF